MPPPAPHDIFRPMTLDGFPRIAADLAICGGRPTVAGTRMRVTDILDMLASGVAKAQILDDFTDISREDIRACLAYAARTTLDRPEFKDGRLPIIKVQGGYVPAPSNAGSSPPRGGSAAKLVKKYGEPSS